MRLACVIALLFVSMPAAARCRSSWWNLSPAFGEIPANARFVLDAYGTAQRDLEKLEQFGPALVSGSHRVALKVAQLNVGEMSVTQAVLLPVEPLHEGQRYRLAWKKVPKELSTPRILAIESGGKAKAPKPPTDWLVTARDDVAPKWTASPSPLKGVREELGCGPEVFARVELQLDDPTALIRARVVRKDEVSEFLLPWSEGAPLLVGHGMCAGPFALTDGPWRLELSAVDVAGNLTPAPVPAMPFRNLDPEA